MDRARSLPPDTCDNVLTVLIHAIASAYFVLLAARLLAQEALASTVPLPDLLVTLLFIVGVLSYCTCSSLYRIVSLLDSGHAAFWQRVEKVGVIVLIWSFAVPFLFFQFHDNECLLWLYLGLITVIGVRSSVNLLAPPVERSVASNLMPIVIAFGVLCFLPVGHVFFWGSACHESMVPEYVKYTALNVAGGLIYIARLPEWWNLMSGWAMRTYIMNLFLIYTAVLYSDKLIRACTSPTIPLPEQCSLWI
ncbi:hypothetical protein PISL3812_09874 [Talaromyces islandicus]|uniref:Uncharacterized protein n=1 Tax=Talaromyces islandicus TaxID=28573 RepID=A0A0U1MCX7_TALIS|nr:hypothetical protein PISL3812_09874 [Talaromyces islandicus]